MRWTSDCLLGQGRRLLEELIYLVQQLTRLLPTPVSTLGRLPWRTLWQSDTYVCKHVIVTLRTANCSFSWLWK